ncbi:MAG: hypothetical protein RR501_10280 [Cloacibacillus sp.]
MTRNEEIKKEISRLRRQLKNAPPKKKTLVEKLIEHAAFLHVLISEVEDDIDTNGRIEMFSQSADAEPYERERPSARQYNQYMKTYSTIIKQLTDLLNKEQPKEKTDALDRFIESNE